MGGLGVGDHSSIRTSSAHARQVTAAVSEWKENAYIEDGKAKIIKANTGCKGRV